MDEIEAGAELIKEFSCYAPVKVAFWLREGDDDYRYLYLASDRIDESNRGLAYKELLSIIDKHRSIYLDPSRIQLISGNDRFALAAIQISEKYADSLGASLRSIPFGDQYIADAYVYPSPLSPNFPKPESMLG